MKKIILGLILAATGSVAFAGTDACVAGTATDVPGATDGTKFVRETFKPACSANTHMVYTDAVASNKLYGGAISTKGSAIYGATSLGGVPTKVQDCTNKVCAGANAAANKTTAEIGETAAAAYGS